MGTSKRETAVPTKPVPGPGSYSIKGALAGPSFGLRGKADADKKPNLLVPGPGQYSPNSKAIEEKLTHGYSFTGRTSSVEMPKEASKQVPGPGNYNHMDAVAVVKGRSPAPVFGNEQRPGMEIKPMVKNPGPGTYTSSVLNKTDSPHFKYAILSSSFQRQ